MILYLCTAESFVDDLFHLQSDSGDTDEVEEVEQENARAQIRIHKNISQLDQAANDLNGKGTMHLI